MQRNGCSAGCNITETILIVTYTWYIAFIACCVGCELVWPSGKQRDLGSNLLRLYFLFKSCGLWTLSCDFVPHNYETLKEVSSLPADLNAEIILVVTV